MSAEKIKPISPKEVISKKLKLIPDQAIEAFNELIVQNNTGGLISIVQDEVVELMVAKGLNRKDIFEKGWLDIEGIYRKAGWDVEYDAPGYNENFYKPHYIFSRRRRRSDCSWI